MRFAGIMENDFTDGIGISVSFWTQGCPHHCKGCHNPDTWDFNGGNVLPDNYVQKTIESIYKNGLKRNLSILGGEPLCRENAFIVYNLIRQVKEFDSSIRIFLWTGYKYEDLYMSENFYVRDAMKYIDILIDGPFILKYRDITLHLKGSTNQRVIDVQKTREADKIILFE